MPAEPTASTDPVADLRAGVASWQGFYRQCLRAANGNKDLATIKLIDLMMSSGMNEGGAGTAAMAVRMIQEGPGVQPDEDTVQIEPIPGHPEFEDALNHMREGLSRMVEHGRVHIECGDSDSENTACTYHILTKTLSRLEMAGFLSGAVTALAKLGWKP
jgi:hypothetical protein